MERQSRSVGDPEVGIEHPVDPVETGKQRLVRLESFEQTQVGFGQGAHLPICRQSEIASGDHREAAKRVAAKLGVAAWRARLTPEAKLARIAELNRRPGGVIMVGDGINDAPVLGAARVSVAMGSGSALAHASADSILMSQSLLVLPNAVQTARRTLQIIHQNLWWAAGYNILAVPLAAFGAIPPWAAAVATRLISSLEEVQDVATRDGELIVQLRKKTDDYSFIARILLEHGLRIHAIREEDVDLETAFMRLTQGAVQ